MWHVKGTKSGARIQHCGSCGEVLPPYSRLCPYCLYSKYFSAEALCHVDPTPYLRIMRCYVAELVEMAEPDIVGRRNELREREIVASFETAESVLRESFSANGDVVEAADSMVAIVEGELLRRTSITRRRRWMVASCAVVVIIVIALLII